MIEDLRWIDRFTAARTDYEGGYARHFPSKTERVLQAYDGHVWFDVPTVEIEMEADR